MPLQLEVALEAGVTRQAVRAPRVHPAATAAATRRPAARAPATPHQARATRRSPARMTTRSLARMTTRSQARTTRRSPAQATGPSRPTSWRSSPGTRRSRWRPSAFLDRQTAHHIFQAKLDQLRDAKQEALTSQPSMSGQLPPARFDAPADVRTPDSKFVGVPATDQDTLADAFPCDGFGGLEALIVVEGLSEAQVREVARRVAWMQARTGTS
jgi:hypothetical protein